MRLEYSAPHDKTEDRCAVSGIPGLLAGNVAIVTGAASGIGRAIACALASSGAAVAIGDINAQGAAQLAAELAASGQRCLSGKLDITSTQSCESFVALVEARLGPVSMLINNAGILRSGALDDPAFAVNWKDCFNTNVNGTVNMTTAALPALRRTRGCILNLCSTSAFLSSNQSAAYAASKGAIAALTRSLAVELGSAGIRVNAVAPGIVNTGIAGGQPLPSEMAAQYQLRTPLARMAEPTDIAGPALFLVSGLAAHVTGVVLPVDGGYLATGIVAG
jgi:NAD(P)-dependent dehydrogenase (short-subunit alcohol dehydrogenase family)